MLAPPTPIAMRIEKQDVILKINIIPEMNKTMKIQIHKMTRMQKET